MAEQEARDNLIPVRRWIRGHYTKLTRSDEATCNHCNGKFIICIYRLDNLHYHLVENHPDKLTEEEKKEVKFYWIWDYFTLKGDTKATCEICKATIHFICVSDLKRHLKIIHKIFGPSSDSVINNENNSYSDLTLRKAKHHVPSSNSSNLSNNLHEYTEGALNEIFGPSSESAINYESNSHSDAISDLTLRKAKHQEASSNSSNLSNNLHECTEGALNEEVADNLIPVRRWIRGHYSKLTRNNEATCNHCNVKFIIFPRRIYCLHKHLIEAHPDKLTEEENKEVKFHWIWDYFTSKGDTRATCEPCKATINCSTISNLKKHLKIIHRIFGPSSDSAINNGSDSYSDANSDLILRKAKHQEASSNSSNLSNNLHECTEGALNEEVADNLIPVRRWIRGHYSKLTRNNEATCNHCNVKFIIFPRRIYCLHKHLVEAHPDKLTEKENKEAKFSWTWDYFTLKGDTKATCKICKAKIAVKECTLKKHLKRIHKIFGPSSDSAINNGSDSYSDANSDLTLRKAKHQEASSNSSNLSNDLHECTEGALNEKAADNLIPVRRWIRGHYSKLTRNNEATCNHCNAKFVIHTTYLIILHKHLVEAHPDKLTEEENKEVKFSWTWDYFTLKGDTKATCKICKVKIAIKECTLKEHLKRIHKIFGPSSDSAINNGSDSYSDTNSDLTLRKAKHQEASSNSSNLSNNLHECTEEALNEEVADNLIPVRRWIRGHYSKLTRNNEATCNHCNVKFIIFPSRIYCLHKHLVEAHPDKLTEEENKEVKFHWTWDYFTLKGDTKATCEICEATINCLRVSNLKQHLERVHKISVPNSSSVINNGNSLYNDANKDTTLRRVKYHEDNSCKSNLSNSLYESTEGTEAPIEKTADN